MGGVPGHAAPPQLQLSRCGIRGHCLTTSREIVDGQMDVSKAPGKQDMLQSTGLKLLTTGFTSTDDVIPEEEGQHAPCEGFEALAPTPIILGPGETVTGSISLETT